MSFVSCRRCAHRGLLRGPLERHRHALVRAGAPLPVPGAGHHLPLRGLREPLQGAHHLQAQRHQDRQDGPLRGADRRVQRAVLRARVARGGLPGLRAAAPRRVDAGLAAGEVPAQGGALAALRHQLSPGGRPPNPPAPPLLPHQVPEFAVRGHHCRVLGLVGQDPHDLEKLLQQLHQTQV